MAGASLVGFLTLVFIANFVMSAVSGLQPYNLFDPVVFTAIVAETAVAAALIAVLVTLVPGLSKLVDARAR